MTELHSMGLVALCLMFGGCTSYVDVDVTVVDAISRVPIPDVRVEQAFHHYLGIKRMTREESVLGSTDSRGDFSVGRRDMYSKSYSIGFYKDGFDRSVLLLYRVKGEGSKYQIFCNDDRVAMGKATDSTNLVIPMRRK